MFPTGNIIAMSDNPVAEFLAEHPKMCGVVFTACLLLTQATPVLAGGSTNGP